MLFYLYNILLFNLFLLDFFNIFSLIFLFLNKSLYCLKNINYPDDYCDRENQKNLKDLEYVFSYELCSPENSSLSTHELSDKFIVKYAEETLHKLY